MEAVSRPLDPNLEHSRFGDRDRDLEAVLQPLELNPERFGDRDRDLEMERRVLIKKP